jgi:hypothetical protein
MLHSCSYTICLVFCYTLWHFYVFSGTNLDEVLTRQCPCLGLSIHGAYVGAWRIRQLQTETWVYTNLPRFAPPEGKDLHPACLILYCLYNWSCYNGAQMGSGYGRKSDGVC